MRAWLETPDVSSFQAQTRRVVIAPAGTLIVSTGVVLAALEI